MANNNVTSVMNGSAVENGNGPANGLAGSPLAFLTNMHDFLPMWIINVIFNMIYALGILANVILLMYLIYYKRYKTPVFCVILSLGVADLGNCVGSLIYYTLVYPYILGPLWLCKVVEALSQLTYLSSSYHIAMFAILRFVQLVYPLASRSKVTTSLLLKVCLTMWGIHFIQVICLADAQQAVNVSIPGGNDVYVCTYTGNLQVVYLLIIIGWCCVPFFTTFGFHIAKQVVVVLSHSVAVTSQDERVQQSRKQTDSRALAFVIVMYLVTMLPYVVQAFRVHVLNITNNSIQVFLTRAFSQLTNVNSAINPWTYLFAAESVRSDIKHMLACNTSKSL